MDEILRAFDETRRAWRPDRRGVRQEIDEHVARTIGTGSRGWFSVDWSALDEDTADEVIREQVAFFAGLGEAFEWKLFDYDRPADLGRRLLDAGFVAGEPEAVMVRQIEGLPAADPPDGVQLVEVADAAGVDELIAVHDEVFESDHARMREELIGQIADEPRSNVLVLARAGRQAVAASRLEMPPGGAFASLWGGGTVPAWRGRGLYRAMVSYRAAIAARKGFRYLHVDASSESRPILERLGFLRLATTTPYEWTPPS